MVGVIVLALAILALARARRPVEPSQPAHVDPASVEQQVYAKLYGRRSSNVSPVAPHEGVTRDSHRDARPRQRPSGRNRARSAEPSGSHRGGRARLTELPGAARHRLRIRATQEHVDAAVSKTVNLPASATVADFKEIYMRAWRSGVKGITVYRYGSMEWQVLTFMSRPGEAPGPPSGAELRVHGRLRGARLRVLSDPGGFGVEHGWIATARS